MKKLVAVFFGLLVLGSPSAWAQKLVPAYQVQVYVTNTPHLGSSSTTLQQMVENTIDPMLGRSDDITDHFSTNAGNTELSIDSQVFSKAGLVKVSNTVFTAYDYVNNRGFSVNTNNSDDFVTTLAGAKFMLAPHTYAFDGFGVSGDQVIWSESADLVLGVGRGSYNPSNVLPAIQMERVSKDMDFYADKYSLYGTSGGSSNLFLEATSDGLVVTNTSIILRRSLLRATQDVILGVSSVGATTLSTSLFKMQSDGTTADTVITNTLSTPASTYGAGASVQIQVYGSTNIVWTNSTTFHAGPSFTNLPGGISVSTSDLLMLQSTSNKWVVANFTDVP